MIKKEISEIKKQFTHTNTSITKIAGCYVGGEKEKIAMLSDTFLCLPEEETFKYFEIFSKCLSGSLGKNLINMEFPLDSEFGNGTQKKLMDIRDSELKDEEKLMAFYDEVIASYEYVGNYLILLVHGAYDVPAKTTDDLEMEDASDEVYKYILCAICPVELSDAALSYDEGSKNFGAAKRDWIVEKPMNGFLFPAFNDRSTDVHALLYYSKNGEEFNDTFVDTVLGTTLPLTAKTQKASFSSVIEDSLMEECELDTVRNIEEKIYEMVSLAKDEPMPVILDKADVCEVLKDSGVSDEKIEVFEKKYDEQIGEGVTLQATNIINNKAMKVKTSQVEIKCDASQARLLETVVYEGRRCIMIPLDNEVTVNGIPVKPGRI